jgi:CP family cyanate transporter-like MFS transporter
MHESQPQHQATGAMLLVVCAGMVGALNIGKVPSTLPALQQSFGMSLVEASFLVSMFQAAGMLLGLFGGVLADRFGARRVMSAGLMVLALASAVGALSASAAILLVSRALESAGFLLTVLPGPALLRRVVEVRRFSYALGWWGSYMPAGTSLGLALTPWLTGFGGWQLAWWATASAAALMSGLVWRSLPADPPSHAVQVRVLALARNTICTPGPWLLAACFGLYAGQFISVFGFLPTVYQQAGIAPTLAGLLTALGVLVNVLGNVGAGVLMQRGISRTLVMSVTSGVMAVCAVMIFSDSLAFGLRYTAVLMFSTVGGLIPGTLFTTAPRFAPYPGAVSTTTGLMQQGSSIGQFFAPPLVAAVATMSGGWQGGGLMIAAIAVLNTGVAVAVGRLDRALEMRRTR